MPNFRLIRTMVLGILVGSFGTMALTTADLSEFAKGATDDRATLITKWSSQADTMLSGFVDRLDAGEFYARGDTLVASLDGAAATDPLTGEPAGTITPETEQLMVSNVLRAAVEAARATLALKAPDAEARLQAAKDLQAGSPDASILPAIRACLGTETDGRVRKILTSLVAILGLADGDAATRIDAAKTLAKAEDPAEAMNLVVARLGTGEDGAPLETDPAVRVELEKTRQHLHDRVFFGQVGSSLFSGVSLASVLLLAALGLAITYGLLGVINMAHGELMMIGAYSTWLVQGLFRSYLPGLVDWYLLAALPVAFVVAALIGIALERSILRFLYGRPLETLLATWGISLFLMQAVRSLFGPQNVEVANPVWMSGAYAVQANLVLSYNRLVIIGFAIAVIVGTWLLLSRTRLGLFIRATTQNRTMARCVGVRTAKVDMLAFGLGSGLAGLAGVALSQIGNVGPDLGQAYIIDSFLVVVVGGVGQLAGTIWAALGLGGILKFLEPMAGAVPAKIALLCAIILFIQKKPAGLFAFKGRQAD